MTAHRLCQNGNHQGARGVGSGTSRAGAEIKLIAQQAAELERRDKLLKEQETELDQMKRERDAAVEDLHKLCPTWKWDGRRRTDMERFTKLNRKKDMLN